MLRLIPAPLHRALYRVAYSARRQWWRIRRPRRGSVVVIAFDDDGRVLLVRHSYGPLLWALPGGGIDRGEQPAEAAVREIREELGCGLAELEAIEADERRIAGARVTQHVFRARLAGRPVADMREIVAIELARPDRLPENCGARTRQRIAHAVALRRSQQR